MAVRRKQKIAETDRRLKKQAASDTGSHNRRLTSFARGGDERRGCGDDKGEEEKDAGHDVGVLYYILVDDDEVDDLKWWCMVGEGASTSKDRGNCCHLQMW